MSAAGLPGLGVGVPGGAWSIGIVEMELSVFPRVTVDDANAAHVVGEYLDRAVFQVKVGYYSRVGPVWVRETLLQGHDPDVAVDSQGRPHVIFQNARGGGYYGPLVHAVREPTGWVYENVTSGIIISTFIEIGPDDTIHVAYRLQSRAIEYARLEAGGSWTIETIDPSGSNNYDLVLDPSGEPVLAYKRGLGDNLMRFASRESDGSWVYESVPTCPRTLSDPAVGFDAGGTMHAVCYDGTRIMYTQRAPGGTWTTAETIKPGRFGEEADLAVSADGVPHVSFSNHPFDTAFGASLWHGVKTPAGWVTEQVDPTGFRTGRHSSIVLDSFGVPRIAYAHGQGPLGHLGPSVQPGDEQLRLAEPVIAAASFAAGTALDALT